MNTNRQSRITNHGDGENTMSGNTSRFIAGAFVLAMAAPVLAQDVVVDINGPAEPDLEDYTSQGAQDYSGQSGTVTINIGTGGEFGAWRGNAASLLSANDDTVNVGDGGVVHTSIFSGNSDNRISEVWTIDFGDGEDTVDNRGRILVGTNGQPGYSKYRGLLGNGGGIMPNAQALKSELRLSQLEILNNHGDIHLGVGILETGSGAGSPDVERWEVLRFRAGDINGTDRWPDDMLSLEGAHLAGHEGSRIFMDVNVSLDSLIQDRCEPGVRLPNDNLPANDCVNLRGGTTSGHTGLVLTDIGFAKRGAYNPEGNVLIDVSGGQSAQGHFTVDPATYNYTPVLGGSYDKGLFLYTVAYDENTQQHKLVGIPSGAAWHQPMIVNAALSAWRTATGSFFDRQADLRDTLRGSDPREHGIWLRVAYDAGERDLLNTTSTSFGSEIALDNSHDVNTSAVTVGVDFLQSGGGESYWVVGGMLGYVRTDLEFDQWPNTPYLNGASVGLYGSYVDGPLFVDGTINGIWSRLDHSIPQAQFFDDRPLSSDVDSLGAQLEAGWRFGTAAARIEPLLNLNHVVTSIEDMKAPEGDPTAPGNTIAFNGDTTSTRVGAGLRGSTALSVAGDLKLGLTLTGRFMSELDGEASATIVNEGAIDPVVTDTLDGTFSEVIAGATLANSTGRVSGILNVGGKFGDDYEAWSGSVSFRYQW